MKLIAGGLNGQYLAELQMHGISKTSSVKVAVAYASSDPILCQDCRKSNIKLTFWGRYDRSVPVTTAILQRFLDRKSPNYVCKLVPDIFHAKVIWWEGYGAYVGSANLTDSAWFGNIEMGIFLTDSEIVAYGLEEELNDFFEQLDNHSFPLTWEIYRQLCELEKKNHEIDRSMQRHFDDFEKHRIVPPLTRLTRITRKSSFERRREKFLVEWHDTLQILRDVAQRVSETGYRPKWVGGDVPTGVQADQFLHAYYYANVKKGLKALHHEFYEKNRNDPEDALVKAMEWWKSLEDPPHSEDITIYEWAKYLKEKLSKQYLVNLTLDEFVEVCKRVHAMRDHSLRVKYTSFGFQSRLPKMNMDQRIELLGKWLFEQHSTKGLSVLKTIDYVLYGGGVEKLTERLWQAAESPEWRIPHLGISSLGEMVGWAMPDVFPPRNGRTSKALTALGFKVKIHSE